MTKRKSYRLHGRKHRVLSLKARRGILGVSAIIFSFLIFFIPIMSYAEEEDADAVPQERADEIVEVPMEAVGDEESRGEKDDRKCGDALIWGLEKSGSDDIVGGGLLSIKGEGDMYDYADPDDGEQWAAGKSAPWLYQITGDLDVSQISVQEGVTGIGGYAFSLLNPYRVELPASMKIIHTAAFTPRQSSFLGKTRVYYAGTRAQWQAIQIGENNELIAWATVYCSDGVIVPVFISDQRSAAENTDAILIELAEGESGPYTLQIFDSDGDRIFPKIARGMNAIGQAFRLSLIDREGNEATDVGIANITLPLPASVRSSNGTLQLYALRTDGSLEEIAVNRTEEGGIVCAQFETAQFSDYAFIYNGPVDINAAIDDRRADSTAGASIAALLQRGESGPYTLIVNDSDGETIRNRLDMKENSRIAVFSISLRDGTGDKALDYGALTLTWPLPADADPGEHTVSVIAVTEEGTQMDYTCDVEEINGVRCLRFQPPGDATCGILYTLVTERAQNASVAEEKPSDSNEGSADTHESNSDNVEESAGDNNGGGDGGTQNIGVVNSPAATAPVDATPAEMPAATGSNYMDMPRTGGGDAVRLLLAIMLFLFGSIELVSIKKL